MSTCSCTPALYGDEWKLIQGPHHARDCGMWRAQMSSDTVSATAETAGVSDPSLLDFIRMTQAKVHQGLGIRTMSAGQRPRCSCGRAYHPGPLHDMECPSWEPAKGKLAPDATPEERIAKLEADLKAARNDVSRYHEQMRDLTAAQVRANNEARHLRDQISYLQRDLNNERRNKIITPPPMLSSSTWKTLMFLCHPDRNANSPEANEVTRWLVSVKPKGT